MDKLLRTLQVNFPYLLEAKFAAKSLVSAILRRPQEGDFRALSLFPDLEGALYLDVGANRGQSIEAILMLTQRACVMSFEPNRLLADRLARRFRNNPRVTVNAFGLGDQNGAFTLYVPYYKAWMFDGLASLKKDSAMDWLKGRVFGYRERYLTVREVQCSVKRLDDLGLAPFFIKLDVQGYEYEALTGGEQTLIKHEPILLIESPDEQTCRYLQGLGYRPHSYEAGRLTPGTVGFRNTYFMTDGKASLAKSAD